MLHGISSSYLSNGAWPNEVAKYIHVLLFRHVCDKPWSGFGIRMPCNNIGTSSGCIHQRHCFLDPRPGADVANLFASTLCCQLCCMNSTYFNCACCALLHFSGSQRLSILADTRSFPKFAIVSISSFDFGMESSTLPNASGNWAAIVYARAGIR